MQVSIKLDADGKNILVKKGQEVDFDTPLFQRKQEELVVVPLAAKMGIAPSEIFISLKKVIGDRIKEGELIAERRGLIITKRYLSEFAGVIREIDHAQGTLHISAQSQNDEVINSFFRGIIEDIVGNTLTLKLPKGTPYELASTTASFGGQVFRLNYPDNQTIHAPVVSGHVVIAKTFPDYEQAKLEALGALGLITVNQLSSNVGIAQGVLKNEKDIDKIFEGDHPYCIVDHDSAIIYFYS